MTPSLVVVRLVTPFGVPIAEVGEAVSKMERSGIVPGVPRLRCQLGCACYHSRMTSAELLAELCGRYGVDALYAFGSRAAEVAAFVRGQGVLNSPSASDLDLGVLPAPDRRLDGDDRVRLTIELEDLFGGPRVDLVVLPQARPYLALDVVSGERLFCADPVREAEYELFVLRRAGDLAFFERERRRMLLAGIAP